MKTVAQHFGARLRELRDGKGLTQSELGRQTHIADLEAGRKWPRQRTVEDLASRLRCEPSELFRFPSMES